MKFLILIVVVIGNSLSQDTTTHHVTHAPPITDGLYFYYETYTKQMIIRSGHTCYIFTLTDQDKIEVHTNSGIRQLEVKLLRLIDTGTRTQVTNSTLNAHLVSACGRQSTTYFTVM